MFQHAHRHAAHGAVTHAGEHRVAQFVEQRAAQAQRAVAEQQRQRQRQQFGMGVGIQAVDDVLEDQRNADVGGLGQDQEGQRQQHAATVVPEERHQRPQGADITGAAVGQFGGVDVGAHGVTEGERGAIVTKCDSGGKSPATASGNSRRYARISPVNPQSRLFWPAHTETMHHETEP